MVQTASGAWIAPPKDAMGNNLPQDQANAAMGFGGPQAGPTGGGGFAPPATEMQAPLPPAAPAPEAPAPEAPAPEAPAPEAPPAQN